MNDEVVKAVEFVEDMCGPDKMEPEEAIEFLRDVIEQLTLSAGALAEELDVDW